MISALLSIIIVVILLIVLARARKVNTRPSFVTVKPVPQESRRTSAKTQKSRSFSFPCFRRRENDDEQYYKRSY
uniref:Expressed protein n=1 Tax=Echinococcus granulosus TaxID=6210 RepID=A0A068WLZ4_ECHGR|nr:expressed protein [Echinococcus granulosus]